MRNFECETWFSLRRFREKSLRLTAPQHGGTLCLVEPQRICGDYRGIWSLEGYIDAVLVYNQEKDAITHNHYIHG